MEEIVGRKVTVSFNKARLDGHFELLCLLSSNILRPTVVVRGGGVPARVSGSRQIAGILSVVN
jgi:hypothetical protein